MATDIPSSLADVSHVAASPSSSLTDDFARLRGDELKAALGDLSARATQALAVAQRALGERAAERKRVLHACKTATVQRQLDAVPALRTQVDLLLKAEVDAVAEDKQKDKALALLKQIAVATLPKEQLK